MTSQIRRMNTLRCVCDKDGQELESKARLAAATAAVHRIAHDGQTRRREVDADLMGAAGLGSHLEQARSALRGSHGGKALQDAPGRHGSAAVRRAHRHALAIARMAADGTVDATALRHGCAAHHGEIDPLDRMVAKLLGERDVIRYRDLLPRAVTA